MRSLIILLLINFQLLSTSYGQEINLDAVINTALAHSEKALYEGRLAEAKDMVAIEQFKDNEGFNINHEILLTIQKILPGMAGEPTSISTRRCLDVRGFPHTCTQTDKK